MRLDPPEDRSFLALLSKSQSAALSRAEEQELRRLVAKQNPRVTGERFTLPEVVEAGRIIVGVAMLRKALAGWVKPH